MKKLILQILFLLMVIPAIAQNYVSITGTVTDVTSGNPIPNHEVFIYNDSTSGWYYSQVLYTNSQGFYVDTVPVPVNTQGLLFVKTIDCQNYPHVTTLTFMPSQLHFTADFSICYNSNPCAASFTYWQTQPLTIQFTDASVGGGTTRLWNFGDGNSSNEMNPVHQYQLPGYYMVSLTIGALGTTCYNTISQNVYVWDSTGAGCQAFFLTTPAPNTLMTYNFTDLSSGNIASWNWNFGDGSTSNEQNPTHTFAQTGVYMTCLTIQGIDSTCYDTFCDTLTVGYQQPCNAAFTYYTDSTSINYTLHFIDLSTGDNLTWLWNFGDGTSSGDQNPVHSYSAPGYYGVMLTITSQNPSVACTSVAFDTIFAGTNAGCQANFNYNVSPTGGNYTVYFNDLSTGSPTSWLWSFGDGTSSNIQNPIVHTYAAPGTYNVCLTIAGANNCTSTLCQSVVIPDSINNHQVYGQVFAGNFPLSLGMAMIFSLDTNQNYQPFVAVCPIDSNGVYYFTAVPDGNYYIMAIPFDSAGYLPTYFGNTLNWEEATLITLGTENNPYNINLVLATPMTNGPGSTSGQINTGDVIASMVDKINMILLNEQGLPLGFTQVSNSGEFNFPSMAYGTYFLRPEMPGVTSEAVKVILTPEKPHADVVMTFTGNSILAIRNDAILTNHWSVYPNPVSDNLTISLDMEQATRAEAGIYNISGQLVTGRQVTLNMGSNSIGISLAPLPSGIYYLRINSREGVILNTKIIKIK